MAFLEDVSRAYRRVPMHLVCTRLRHPQAREQAGVAHQAPRLHMHFTLPLCSWLNIVEMFFQIIARRAIRRGTFHRVRDRETAIGTYIDRGDERACRSTWTNNADEFMTRAKRSPNQKKTFNPRH